MPASHKPGAADPRTLLIERREPPVHYADATKGPVGSSPWAVGVLGDCHGYGHGVVDVAGDGDCHGCNCGATSSEKEHGTGTAGGRPGADAQNHGHLCPAPGNRPFPASGGSLGPACPAPAAGDDASLRANCSTTPSPESSAPLNWREATRASWMR